MAPALSGNDGNPTRGLHAAAADSDECVPRALLQWARDNPAACAALTPFYCNRLNDIAQNLSGAFKVWERALVDYLCSGVHVPRAIVEVGAGFSSVGVLLATRGFEVYAIERTASALAIGIDLQRRVAVEIAEAGGSWTPLAGDFPQVTPALSPPQRDALVMMMGVAGVVPSRVFETLCTGMFRYREFIIDIAHFGCGRRTSGDRASFRKFLDIHAHSEALIIDDGDYEYRRYRNLAQDRSFAREELTQRVLLDDSPRRLNGHAWETALPTTMTASTIYNPARFTLARGEHLLGPLVADVNEVAAQGGGRFAFGNGTLVFSLSADDRIDNTAPLMLAWLV